MKGRGDGAIRLMRGVDWDMRKGRGKTGDTNVKGRKSGITTRAVSR